MREGPFLHGIASRRDLLTAMCTGGLALSLPRPPVATASFQIISGTVYENLSGSGFRTAHDPGVPGVLVSNGRDVTRTDGDGSWVLPWRDGEPVFVVKPAHWKVSSRTAREASFWRNYSSPSEIDFALERRPEPDQFEVLLVADTQACNRQELSYVRQDLLAASRETKAAFAIHHGDAMSDDLSLLPEYLDILDQTGLSWHHCPGNHDMDTAVRDGANAFATWKRLVGPAHYAFEYGRALFIVLNNVEYVADPTWHSHKPYRGRIGPDQLQFVKNVLAEVPNGQLAVVSMHIPLASFTDPDNPTVTTDDRHQLLQLLSSRTHAISFAGHSHTSEHHYLGEAEGYRGPGVHHHQVLTAACGSWWSGERDAGGVPASDSRDGTPRGHHVLSVSGVEATTRFVNASAAGPAQVRLMLCAHDATADEALLTGLTPLAFAPGADIRQGELDKLVLIADVFDGGPRTVVSFEVASVADLNTQTMFATATVDPFVAESYQRAPQLCKPWVAACVSSHIWAARVPADLPTGRHTLRVSARTEFGAAHTDDIVFDVVA